MRADEIELCTDLDGLGAGVDSSVSSSCVMLMIPLLSADHHLAQRGQLHRCQLVAYCLYQLLHDKERIRLKQKQCRTNHDLVSE